MLTKDKFESNTITGTLTKWIQQQEWEKAIEVENSLEKTTFSTRITINDQPHDMFFEADEANCWLSVYLYGPIKVLPSRMGEMARLLNKINLRLTIGRLACIDDNEPNPVQYRARIDLKGGSLAENQIDTLAIAACRIFTLYDPIIKKIALTKKSASRCWAELLEAEVLAPPLHSSSASSRLN